MKQMTLGLSVLVGGLLAVSSVQADYPHGGPAGNTGDEKHGTKSTHEQKAEIKLQTTCPVMGGAIDKNQYVDHDGKRVYICCPGCVAPLKKDPAKYIQKLEAEGVTVAKLQTTCPVLGGAIDKALYVDHGGKRIYVCCQECIATIKKDPAKHVKSLEETGVALDSAAKSGKSTEPKKAAGGHKGHQH